MPEPAMRVFVAGEHGQVADALGLACVSRGHTVLLAGRARADLINYTVLAAAVSEFRPDIIVNAAAYTAVDKAEDEAEHAFRLNCDGAENLALGAAAARTPLIHLSTDYVYDGAKPSPYVETDTPLPIGVYGSSKLAGEAAITAIGGNYIILRTSWVCSPGGNNFVKTMLRLATERDEIRVVDDQWGTPTFAADLAHAIVSIGEFLVSAADRSTVTGIYHICGTGHTTRFRFARAIMQGSAERGGPSCRIRAITTQEYPTRAKRPANSRLDCSKLARVFGLRLPPWKASLSRCLDQLLATP
jgi:dTDP-4-dehydrorhamnose reductase